MAPDAHVSLRLLALALSLTCSGWERHIHSIPRFPRSVGHRRRRNESTLPIGWRHASRHHDCRERLHPAGNPGRRLSVPPDTQLYRVIRQGDIIFVSVSWNSSSCVPRAYPLDGGARYAISTDGRILRRLVGIEPDGFPREEPPRVSIPVPNHLVGHPFEEIRAYYRDAGIPFPGESPADGGVPAPPDGGLAGDPRDGGT